MDWSSNRQRLGEKGTIVLKYDEESGFVKTDVGISCLELRRKRAEKRYSLGVDVDPSHGTPQGRHLQKSARKTHRQRSIHLLTDLELVGVFRRTVLLLLSEAL